MGKTFGGKMMNSIFAIDLLYSYKIEHEKPDQHFGPLLVAMEYVSKNNSLTIFDYDVRAVWRSVGRQERTCNVYIEGAPVQPPAPSLILPALQQAREDYNVSGQTIPALMQWYFDYESAHPLDDYNGRTGRAMVMANLYVRGVRKSFSKILYEKSNDHYLSFRNLFTKKRFIEYLTNYFGG
jgi:Fic family protein